MIFYIVILIAYLSLTIFTGLKISKSRILSVEQKRIHLVLNALIPVLWFYLVSPIIFPKSRIITREEREKTSHRFQNGTGSSSDSIYY